MTLWTLHEGDCVEVMKQLPDNSVDSVVTDPPYELGFMGKKWDSTGIAYSVVMWREVLRVLKPGGHVLAFGGTRTYHRMACAIEDAGFEIRDQLQWLYGSGFPKSMELGKQIDKAAGVKREVIGQLNTHDIRGNALMDRKGSVTLDITAPSTPEAVQWDGWGTALKPANEPICLARKPLAEATIAANVLKWGTGALNIEACRIPVDPAVDDMLRTTNRAKRQSQTWEEGSGFKNEANSLTGVRAEGRFPANILLDEEAAAMLDEQTGFGASGGASRFFYVAKASKSERGENNLHPTVKPLKLMRYLVRLITPPGGTVLDPFAGSGTTLLAAEREGFDSVGIEMNPEYCEIIRRRMAGTPPVQAALL